MSNVKVLTVEVKWVFNLLKDSSVGSSWTQYLVDNLGPEDRCLSDEKGKSRR